MSNLWESVFTAGPTPTLLVATNLTFGSLQLLLLALFIATYSIHFIILSVLCGGLWWSINWFASELQQAQAKEAEAERLRRRKVDEADDEGEDTEVEGGMGLKDSYASVAELSQKDTKAREGVLESMSVPPSEPAPAKGAVSSGLNVGSEARQRKLDGGDASASEMSTDSEWEKVDEAR